MACVLNRVVMVGRRGGGFLSKAVTTGTIGMTSARHIASTPTTASDSSPFGKGLGILSNLKVSEKVSVIDAWGFQSIQRV
jgi:hypothetical protein